MNILRKTWRLIVSLFAGILATTDSPGTPAFKKPSRTELMVALMDANNRLKVAAHALALVECMTAPNTKYTPRSVIHKIAFDAYGEAKNKTE